MAKNNDVRESTLKSGQQFSSMETFSTGLQVGSTRQTRDIYRVLGDPRISVGLPVRDELTAASNLLVNKASQ
jgi:hypothetical protein